MQNNNAPHKTKISLSDQPDQEWMACFFKHWKEIAKNIVPKPEIQFDGKQMLIISRSVFAIRFIIPALKCIEKANSEQWRQIKANSELIEEYMKGITANPL